MKRALITLTVVSILAFGAMAFAHGYGGWSGGHMMGPGYGGHMMESGSRGHMMDRGTRGFETDQKFLNETTDLRKGLHEKRFQYFEARRNPDTTTETLTELEKDIYELQENIHEKAPRTAYSGTGVYGHCL
jgi:hypothetical protein